MDEVLEIESLPEALRPFEVAVSDLNADTLRDHLERLRITLMQLRRAEPAERWAACVEAIRHHPVWNVIKQDPFVRRAAEKPRGYPGDAVMIDFIYRVSSVTPEDVRWACERLDQITGAQWRDVFRAAGYRPEEGDRFVAKIKEKIAQGLQPTAAN